MNAVMNMERIQKVIAHAGVCSRRKAEELVKAGRVKINGKTVTELGTLVSKKDVILVDDLSISQEEKEYYLLYKPRNIVSTTNDDKKRKTVVDLIPTDKRIFPVGRLDYDTSGLLFLTNDGELANYLMHPSNHIEKVYIAKIQGILTGEEIKKLKNGVFIDGRKTAKAKVKIKSINKKTNTSIVALTIHEGRNHQVKKMFEAVSHPVLKLKRERIAFFDLSGLKSGEYRKLNPKEVKQLYAFLKQNN